MIIETGPVFLYRLFGLDDVLLYAGISKDPWCRFRNHQRHQYWWPEVASHTFELHPDRHAAERAEQIALHLENPRYNRPLGGIRPYPRRRKPWEMGAASGQTPLAQDYSWVYL